MKYLPILKYALLAISMVAVVVGMSEINLDAMLMWSFGMIVLTIILVLTMPLIGVFQNPQSAKGSLIGLSLVAILFVISYMLATEDPITTAGGKIIDNKGELLYSDTALWATYITFVTAAISIVASEVYNLFK